MSANIMTKPDIGHDDPEYMAVKKQYENDPRYSAYYKLLKLDRISQDYTPEGRRKILWKWSEEDNEWKGEVIEVDPSKTLAMLRPLPEAESHNTNSTATMQTKDKPITNCIETVAAEGAVIEEPLPMREVLNRIRSNTDNWPRILRGKPFVLNDAKLSNDSEYPVDFLNNSQAFFGYLQSKSASPVQWHERKRGCVTKPEAFAEYCRHATEYDAVELLPHEPPIPGHFYVQGTSEAGDGTALNWFLDQFNFETIIDRQLFQAELMTMLWGGPGGTRPLFVHSSKDGPGSGKSKPAFFAAEIFGGYLLLSQSEDIFRIKGRILSPEAAGKRCCIIDNVKTPRFAWGDLEGLVTSPVVSGHKYHVGEGSIGNYFTFVVTMNGVALGQDLATRSIEIKFRKPEMTAENASWESRIYSFIAKHRKAIIGDLIQALRGRKQPAANTTRWGTWDSEILWRLPDPEKAVALIRDRQADCNADTTETADIEDYFADQLRSLHYDPASDVIHVPAATIASKWLSAALGEKMSSRQTSHYLNQAIDERRITRLVKSPRKDKARGYLWTPKDPMRLDPFYDLERRIVEAGQERLREEARIKADAENSARFES